MQDPLILEVHFEHATEEFGDSSAKKEKGEEKIDKASVTMARAIVFDKGKNISTEDEFSYGPIDLISLSPIQALKLATLAQARAS